ncbi:MAG TPA: helix-turn-helix domain-containing protein [Bryobacteraceae bacterium]|nr:helix-turn-helix domain-containing protein [Bryobacteraceae bacterium]
MTKTKSKASAKTATKTTTGKARRKARRVEAGPNVSAIARRVRLSRQTVYRKLRAGKTVKQIESEAEAWRKRKAEEQAWRRQHVNGASGGADARADGNGKVADIETFASAQRRRESAQASLRELEYKIKSAEVVNRAEAIKWFSHLMLPLVNALQHLPSQLRDSLGAMNGLECERLLDSQLRGLLSAAEKYMDECERRAGQPLHDGALKCGDDFYVVWRIVPAAEYERSVPATEEQQQHAGD